LSNLIELGPLDAMPDREVMPFDVDGHQLVVVKAGDSVAVLDAVCPHEGGPLADGTIEDRKIVCPWHGSTFSLDTGELVDGPSEGPVRTYKVQIIGGVAHLEWDLT